LHSAAAALSAVPPRRSRPPPICEIQARGSNIQHVNNWIKMRSRGANPAWSISFNSLTPSTHYPCRWDETNVWQVLQHALDVHTYYMVAVFVAAGVLCPAWEDTNSLHLVVSRRTPLLCTGDHSLPSILQKKNLRFSNACRRRSLEHIIFLRLSPVGSDI
jgi:hypothetical protein